MSKQDPTLITLGGKRRTDDGTSPEQRHAAETGEFAERLPAHAAMASGGDGPAPDDGDGTTRRDFLSLVGFGATAATLAACRAPTQKAIPLAVASPEMVAGVANYYATTCGGCAASCSLLVKQRDGRPIKIEGNDATPLFGGGTCATGQATVLSLYDNERLRGPLWRGEPTPWAELDAQIAAGLAAARAAGKQIVLMSSTITSPSLRALIARFGAAYAGFRHVTYDASSASALRAASAEVLGRAIVPHYAFDRARVIVSLDADFLGTWLSPVEFTRQYRRARDLAGPGALHVQLEPGLSVTGSNADRRIAVAPSELGPIAAALAARIAKRAGEPVTAPADPIAAATLDDLADALWRHRGASLVVSGAADVATQVVVHTLNRLLGNLGATVDVARPSLQRAGDDAAFADLLAAMGRGDVHTLILHGVNPVYDRGDAFAAALGKVALAITTSDRLDETASAVHAVCPDHHFLEAWGDAEPVANHLSLVQPTIAPLFETRAFAESLLRWLGDPTDAYSQLRAHWQREVFPRQRDHATFDAFWDATLERGVLDLGPPPEPPAAPVSDWRAQLAIAATRTTADHELARFETVGLRDGRHANNPWLLELPDPISKLTWGNAAMIAPALADQLGLANGDVVALGTATASVEAPVFVQPGQHPRTVSIAIGFGRRAVGKAGNHVGVNAFPLAPGPVTITATGKHEPLAGTQSHFAMEGRPIVLETTRAELDRAPAREPLPDLWDARPQGDHSWGMTIDLDACTGCSACVVACQAENNVPVVGKDQIQRQRSMHWIRIDRYYTGSAEAPASLHQPMMCQHCGHAPCETVCPVLATTTSSEGLNQQVYNRCIGTRYCANNCPYKVRRFNWYNYTTGNHAEYHMANPVGRLVLNPDVTVRSRGVMEKCSLCVQRIHAAKNAAVQREAPVADGDIKTACQQACPAGAIVFGDLDDPKSAVAAQMRAPRTYKVLDELGTRPNVAYLKKVRHEAP
jgi:molybdopterin-containing oxidoreductase family iron-sulfur binding subunit